MILTPPETKSVPERPFSILIADDDKGNRETLGELLTARGFRTVLAADGGEAVEIVQVHMVHLVLLDLHMPRLSGLEAVELVRQINALLPAILMTADATREVLKQALQAHVYSVIPKPVNANIVLHTLTRALTQVYGPPQPNAVEPGASATGETDNPHQEAR
jgi:CheY-like chemotaxis protein